MWWWAAQQISDGQILSSVLFSDVFLWRSEEDLLHIVAQLANRYFVAFLIMILYGIYLSGGSDQVTQMVGGYVRPADVSTCRRRFTDVANIPSILRFSCQEFCPWKLLKDIRKINLDVVTRYYRVARYLSYYCRGWLAFYHTGLYREYRIPVAFSCGLTADWRLHIAMVCRRGSLVTFHGLTRIKLLRSTHLCWLDVPRAWEWHCGAGLATEEAVPCRCRCLDSSSSSA